VSDAIVYIDRSDIRDGKVEDVKTAIKALVEFIDAHNPKLIDYRFFIDDATGRMILVATHPDSTALEFHMEVGGPEFRKLSGLITLRSIEVFGRPSNRAMQQLHEKAEMLGEDGSVSVHEQFAGFTRLPSG
jgi:hypothetical protein